MLLLSACSNDNASQGTEIASTSEETSFLGGDEITAYIGALDRKDWESVVKYTCAEDKAELS
jgi:hypothetical protein